jgi:hypothetical protein
MKLFTLFFILASLVSHGQEHLREQQEIKRQQIKGQVETNNDKVLVLAKVTGQTDLQRVQDERWPEDVETAFNILKNPKGKIIYIAEFPTSESGDWRLELLHYFDDNGQLIAFEKRLAYFNSLCTEGAVIENVVELYDTNFRVIEVREQLTDNKGNLLQGCEKVYDWTFEKRGTVLELMKLKEIRD